VRVPLVPCILAHFLLGLTEAPHAWAIIPPDQNISRHIEVLLSVDTTIHTVDNLESVDQRISRGPFTHISPSPNGKSLALLTATGTLWVVSTDFQRSMAEFDTNTVQGAEGAVRQVEWCGNDAILVSWDMLVILVGPFGDILQYVCPKRRGCPLNILLMSRYFYSGATFALTEMDGVRIFSNDVCDFVQKVPSADSPSRNQHLLTYNFSRFCRVNL